MHWVKRYQPRKSLYQLSTAMLLPKNQERTISLWITIERRLHALWCLCVNSFKSHACDHKHHKKIDPSVKRWRDVKTRSNFKLSALEKTHLQLDAKGASRAIRFHWHTMSAHWRSITDQTQEPMNWMFDHRSRWEWRPLDAFFTPGSKQRFFKQSVNSEWNHSSSYMYYTQPQERDIFNIIQYVVIWRLVLQLPIAPHQRVRRLTYAHWQFPPCEPIILFHFHSNDWDSILMLWELHRSMVMSKR